MLGRPPLPQHTIDEIVRMRAAGFSERAIATSLGISKSSVNLYSRPNPRSRRGDQAAPRQNWSLERAGAVEPGESFCDPPQRCAEGHLCYVLPCRECVLDRARKAGGL